MSRKRYSMFWNWIRWQCLNREPIYDGEIAAGEIIDGDQFTMQVMGLIGRRKGMGIDGCG